MHRLGKGTDLRRYRNYIIGQLLLSCILMQVLEASQTPLIAWNLRLLLHDKCIWTQSVCNGFVLQERYRPQAKTVSNVHTQTSLCCVCVEVGETNTVCSQSFSRVTDKEMEACHNMLLIVVSEAVDHTLRMSLLC